MSAAARQTVLADAKPSAGHWVLVPVHVSATSQAPTAARQTVPALPGGCWQAALAPLQVSVVQTLPSSVHVVPLGLKASAGQAALVPVQFSARSHSPAEGRQTTELEASTSGGQLLETPSQLSATSHA